MLLNSAMLLSLPDNVLRQLHWHHMTGFYKDSTTLFYKGIVAREMRTSDPSACRIFPFFIDKGSFKNKDFFPSNPRRKRSFKDGLTEQMNSFDECRLSPRSCLSGIGATGVVTDGKRPGAVIDVRPL